MTDNGASGFRPIDIAALVYVLFESAVVLLFMTGKPGWHFLLGFYLASAGVILVFAIFPKYGFFKILRLFYPLILVPILYEALATQIPVFRHKFFDSQINLIEMTILGFDSSFALQRYMTIKLNEFMSFFYISYYLLPFFALTLCLFRKAWDSLERGALAASVAFYISYVIFLLYPVMGPRHYLQNIFYLPIVGPFFTPLAQKIVAGGGLFGGAMPSSHCAVALVFVWFIAREVKTLRAPMWLILVLLCTSTVYGRYHYVSDVAVGLLVGTVAIWLTTRWQNAFLKAKAETAQAIEIESGQPVEITT